MSELDVFFRGVVTGDRESFANWMGRVERPIRASLARFARAVDVEAVVQETLMRMWHFARERGGELKGEDASLRFAIGIARNLARNEARRLGRLQFLPPEDMPDEGVDPAPVADEGLLRFLRDCIAALKGRPREVLMRRLSLGALVPDRTIAEQLNLKLNTFLQNIVRARRQVRDCLVSKGVPAEEIGA